MLQKLKTESIEIRQAHFCDARTIASIGSTSWIEAYRHIVPIRKMVSESLYQTALDVEERMRKKGTCIYIAYYNKIPCGVAILMRKHIGYTELDWLFILPGYRNLNIGAKLIKLCIHKARKEYTRLTLSALRKNIHARRFYERAGGVKGRFSSFSWNGFPAMDVWYTWGVNNET